MPCLQLDDLFENSDKGSEENRFSHLAYTCIANTLPKTLLDYVCSTARYKVSKLYLECYAIKELILRVLHQNNVDNLEKFYFFIAKNIVLNISFFLFSSSSNDSWEYFCLESFLPQK